MTKHMLRCGDLKLLVIQNSTEWSWVIHRIDVKYVATAKNEGSARNACISVAKTRLRGRGMPIPDSLNHPQWQDLQGWRLQMRRYGPGAVPTQ
jgi:hypothetical protein